MAAISDVQINPAQCFGHQLFNQRAMSNVWMLLYKQLETASLVYAAIDVLVAGVRWAMPASLSPRLAPAHDYA